MGSWLDDSVPGGSQGVSMRLSPQHRLSRMAIAPSLVLALAVAFTFATLANASASASTLRLPQPLLQVGPIVSVEASPLPVIEVAVLPKVEAPSIPPLQTPSVQIPPVQVPPVQVPPAPLPPAQPPATPPLKPPPLATTSTPALPQPVAPTSRGATTPSSQAGAGAHASGAGTSAGTAASAPAPARTAASASLPAAARAGRSSRPGGSASHARTRARRLSTSGAAATQPAARVSATTAPAASSQVAHTRSAGGHSSPRKAASGNPLDTIGRHIPFPVPVPDWSRPIILVLLALAIWFAVRSRLAVLRARRLERQRATLLHDRGAMQGALVPAIPERLGDLSVSVAYRPADGPAAGGDFYDAFVLEPGRVAILLGDVAGHGHGALTQAALARYTLRAYVQAGLEPRAALALAGSVLAKSGEQPFATVVIAVHDSASGRLTYACAGHPPPICIGFDLPEPLTVCCSAPICCDLPTGRRQTTISVPAGGAVCFFSDGLLEARGRQPDGFLGRERLVELANEHDQHGATARVTAHAADALLQRVDDVSQTTPDDMVACIVSPLAAPPPAGSDQVEELEVDAQTLGRPHIRRFLDACAVDGAAVAPLLQRAGEIAGEGGTALLRIERPRTGAAKATVLPGLSRPDWTTRAVEATVSAQPALALPDGSMTGVPQAHAAR
jgi:hypothetical protein